MDNQRRKNHLPVLMAGAVLLVVGILALAACASPSSSPQTAGAPVPAERPTGTAVDEMATDTVDVVVQFDNHATAVRRILVTDPISGLHALRAGGFDVATAEYDWGTAVCAIEEAGCPATDCFCDPDRFWSYQFWDGEEWQAYGVGPAASVISMTNSIDGRHAIEGWRWGTGDAGLLDPDSAQSALLALDWLADQSVVVTADDLDSVAGGVEMLLATGANRLAGTEWPQSSVTGDTQEGHGDTVLPAVLAGGPEFAARGLAEAGKLAVALAGVESCWPADAPRPLAAGIPADSRGEQAGPLAWAMLGALAHSPTEPVAGVQTLVELALPDGGWEWSPGWGADTNTTALAIQALVAASKNISADEPAVAVSEAEIDDVIRQGLAYLLEAQKPDGGFAYGKEGPASEQADANSTAYVIQALIAAGLVPAAAGEQPAAANALDFLLTMQTAEGGFVWQAGQNANLSATQQAIPALLGQPFPFSRAPLQTCDASGQ